MTLGTFLAGAREDAGLSREQVIAEPGVAQLGLSIWELRAFEGGARSIALPDLVVWDELVRLYGLDGEDVARGLRLAWRDRVGDCRDEAPSARPLTMAPSPTFAAWLRRTMCLRGVTLVALVAKLAGIRGVSTGQVAGWMTGVSAPDAGQWPLVCDALGLFQHEVEAGVIALVEDRKRGGG